MISYDNVRIAEVSTVKDFKNYVNFSVNFLDSYINQNTIKSFA